MVASETDANGHRTEYAYDPYGNRTLERRYLVYSESDPSQNRYFDTAYDYCRPPTDPDPRCGFSLRVYDRVKSITYPNGSVTEYTYDALANRTQEIRDRDGLHLQTDWHYYDPATPDPGNPGNLAGLLHEQIVQNTEGPQTTEYQYDVYGNPTKIIDPEGHETQYVYDNLGNKRRMTDANGHTWTYDYDGLNRLVKETDPLGYTTEYDYDGNGNRTEVRKQVALDDSVPHQVTRYEYDARNRLVKEIRDPDGLKLTTRYGYDENDNRLAMTDPRGKPTRYRYDEQNRLIEVEDALHNITRTQYDKVGNRIKLTDANGHVTCNQYDGLNRLTVEIRKMGTSPCTLTASNDIVTKTFYDTGNTIPPADCRNGQCAGPIPGSSSPASMIDPENKYTYFKYDAINRGVMTIRKVGDTADDFDKTGDPAEDDWSEIVQYDSVGNVLTRYDANGNATTYKYLLDNLLKQEANALNETTSYTYDGAHNLRTTTTPGGNVVTNTYDDRNELIQVDDSIGRVASYAYDGIGNRLTERDGNGNGPTHHYDAVNRLDSTTDALGRTTYFTYDENGNLIQTTDRELKVACYFYDDINRRTLTAQRVDFVPLDPHTGCQGQQAAIADDPDDVWTETRYDNVGNVQALFTAKNRTWNYCRGTPDADCELTQYAYDEVNRLRVETYPDHDPGKDTREFEYDQAGNLTRRTDQMDRDTLYEYDDLHRLTQRDYEFDPDDSFGYDLAGRMTSASRDGWLVTFAYDAANRVLDTVQNGGNVHYTYDIPHRIRQVRYPGGREIKEASDPRGRLGEIRNVPEIDIFPPPKPIVAYVYDAGNRVTTRTYRNGTQAAYRYDANNWIEELNHTTETSSLIAGFGHAYTPEGNKRYEEKQHDPAHSEQYDPYDDLHRLLHFKVGTLDAVGQVLMPLTQTQYDLDKLGNWDAVNGQPRQHNAVNELTQIDTAPLSYDDNGNLIEDSRYRYEYDQENRLTQVSLAGTPPTDLAGAYRYDALGRRIAKTAGPTRGGRETQYLYDDARIIEERDGLGVSQATYVYGNYIDEVLTMDRDTTGDSVAETYYYHPNALWSVAAITDGAGSVVERVAYDAYGTPTVTDAVGTVLTNTWGTARSGIGNPWLFTGRQLDEETGLYFYRARYYDCEKGRFLQRDWPDITKSANLYNFAGGNPNNLLDPLGFFTVEIMSTWARTWVVDRLSGFNMY